MSSLNKEEKISVTIFVGSHKKVKKFLLYITNQNTAKKEKTLCQTQGITFCILFVILKTETCAE